MEDIISIRINLKSYFEVTFRQEITNLQEMVRPDRHNMHEVFEIMMR